MKPVSIRDIANRAGVSTTTVSFVLNGKAKEKRISNHLKEQILAIAAELNYRPNHVARGLRTGKTNTIGLMVEDIANPFFANLAKIIEDEADKVGYTVMFCCTENNDNRAGSLLHMLKHRQMDGFIITPTVGLHNDVLQLVEEKRPIVLLDRFFPGLNADSVTINNHNGSNAATKWLLERGCRKIGIVTIQSELNQMENRVKGYQDALSDAGLMPDTDLILKLKYEQSKQQSVEEIISFLNEQKPDALIFLTNYLGILGLEAIRKTGMTLPDDMALVCFDDTDLFRLGNPAISVIAQPIEEIAKTAVHVLMQQIRNEPKEKTNIQLTPQLIKRDT